MDLNDPTDTTPAKETTMTKPTMSAEKRTTGTVNEVRFQIKGEISTELNVILTAIGYTVSGQNGSTLWLVSPWCKTTDQINTVRPASLRNHVG